MAIKKDVYIDVEIDENAIQNKVESLIDDETMTQIHKLYLEIVEPWVPYLNGDLIKNTEATAEYARYKAEYAHYQYMGVVYAPNIPIMKDGVVDGWRSPPGKGTKHATDRKLGTDGELRDKDGNVIWKFGYSQKHPLSSAEWDKVAMQTELEKFEQGVKEILARRAKELYG